MSLLLDALRKSANQRHLGAPPGLDEGLRHGAPSTPARRSWLAPILLLMIIVLAVVAKPWERFVHQDTTAAATEDEGSPAEPQASMQAEAVTPTPQTPTLNEAKPVSEKPGVARHTTQPAAEPDYGADYFPEVDTTYSPDDAAYIAEQLYRAQIDPFDENIDYEQQQVDDEAGREVLKEILQNAENSEEYREFISQIAADERGELETHPDFEEFGIQYSQPAGADKEATAQQLAGTEKPTSVAVQPVVSNNPAVASSITVGGGGSTKPERRSRAGRSAPQAPVGGEDEDPNLGIVSYYDLPVAVRSSMPAVNIQIRVYDEDPVRRFVVSGANRVHEGDSLGDGITLHQIRRDGLVLVYQSYVFLWDKR